MSKQESKPAAEPTLADLMALIQAQQKQIAELSAKAPAAVEVDFSAQVVEAEKAGFKAKVVPSLQKGAQPALRVDY